MEKILETDITRYMYMCIYIYVYMWVDVCVLSLYGVISSIYASMSSEAQSQGDFVL